LTTPALWNIFISIVVINTCYNWLAMNISTRGRYALRAMLDLALQSGDDPTMVKDISRRQEISDLYLEQLFSRLKIAGLVRSTRGPKGGFNLAKPPSQIRLSEIMQAMEGSTAPVECVDNARFCSRADFCITRMVWIEMKKVMDEVLVSTTLKDLMRQVAEHEVKTFEA
jgi:Rrf2 family cysteine metabolism transcriptional repressor